jgi:hypothetical protein
MPKQSICDFSIGWNTPGKATLEINQAVIKSTLEHPNFSDFQITQTIYERLAICITHGNMNVNPIECLWGAIKRRLKWDETSTREEGNSNL